MPAGVVSRALPQHGDRPGRSWCLALHRRVDPELPARAALHPLLLGVARLVSRGRLLAARVRVGATARSLVLPAFALGLVQSALIARIARSSMLDVLREQFIVAGRAKGLGERAVVYKHALKNAHDPHRDHHRHLVRDPDRRARWSSRPCSTSPGLGRLIISAVLRRDYPVIQGVVLCIAGVYMLINLAVDLSYVIVRPARAATSERQGGRHERRSRCRADADRAAEPAARWLAARSSGAGSRWCGRPPHGMIVVAARAAPLIAGDPGRMDVAGAAAGAQPCPLVRHRRRRARRVEPRHLRRPAVAAGRGLAVVVLSFVVGMRLRAARRLLSPARQRDHAGDGRAHGLSRPSCWPSR